MKRTFNWTLLLLSLFIAPEIFATYYIAGNGTDDPNGKWCNNKNWEFIELDANNSITFEGVAAGHYGFKITDGEWGSGHEFTTFDYDNSDSPLYGGNGSDMGFTLTEDADITISFVNGKVRVSATKALAYRSNYYYIAGNKSEMGSWSENAVALTNDQITFTNLGAEWYEFKITNGSWDKTWGYSELDVENSSPMHKTYGDGNNICFRIQAAADVTVKMEKGKVVLLIDHEYCITGNKELIGGDTNWPSTTACTLTSANNYTYTFNSLAAGDYRFKVKENVDNAWNDDCTWGYAHLDTENSNAGADWDDTSHNIGFSLSEPTKVTIALVNNKIRLNTTPIYYYVTGDLGEGGWSPDTESRRLNPTTHDITFTDVAEGTYIFRITNGSWASTWNYSHLDKSASSNGAVDNGGSDHNIKITLDQMADITVSFNPNTSVITLTSSVGYFLCEKYSVTGWGLFENNWATDDVTTEMTPVGDGTYKYILRNKTLGSGNYGFRVIGNHSWEVQYPKEGITETYVSITEPGDNDYTITFLFNPAEANPTCIIQKQMDYTISQYGYNTFFYDKAYEIPEGVTAKIATNIDDNAITYEEIEDVIPANTGVLLIGTPNQTYTFVETTTDVTYTENLFKGTISDTEINVANTVHYILSVNNGAVGMYWPYDTDTDDGTGEFTNQAHKAYLETSVLNAPARRGFPFNPQSELPTGIESQKSKVESGKFLRDRQLYIQRDGRIYNAQGVRVQ